MIVCVFIFGFFVFFNRDAYNDWQRKLEECKDDVERKTIKTKMEYILGQISKVCVNCGIIHDDKTGIKNENHAKQHKNILNIKCNIPKNMDKYLLIEYPGKILNVDNAVNTLGGMDTIRDTMNKYWDYKCSLNQQLKSKIESKKMLQIKQIQTNKLINERDNVSNINYNKGRKLEPFMKLSFNPNGVFDHPLFGKINDKNNSLLIKITKKVKKKNKNIVKIDKIDIIGEVTNIVEYKGLADFQVYSELKYNNNIFNNNNNQLNDVSGIDMNKINGFNLKLKNKRLWNINSESIANGLELYPLIPNVFAVQDKPYDDNILGYNISDYWFPRKNKTKGPGKSAGSVAVKTPKKTWKGK